MPTAETGGWSLEARATAGTLAGLAFGLALGRLLPESGFKPAAAARLGLVGHGASMVVTLQRLLLMGAFTAGGAAWAARGARFRPGPPPPAPTLPVLLTLAWVWLASVNIDFVRAGWVDANSFFKYEGVNASLALRALDGQNLYRAVRFPYGILMYAAPAAWLRLTGIGLMQLRVYALALHALGLAAIALWIRRLATHGPTRVAFLAVVPILFFPTPFNAEPHQSTSRVLLGLWVIWAAARASDSGSPWPARWAGALSGLFVFYSPDLAAASFVCSLVALEAGSRRRFVEGFAAVGAAGLLLVAATGGLEGFLWPWTGAARYVMLEHYATPYSDLWRDIWSLRPDFESVHRLCVSWAAHWQVLVCAAAAALLWLRRGSGLWGEWERGMAALVLYRLLLLPRSTQISGYLLVGDYLHLAPAFILAAALVAKCCEGGRKPWRALWALACVSGALVYLSAYRWAAAEFHPLLAPFRNPGGAPLTAARARGIRVPAEWESTIDGIAGFLESKPGAVYDFADEPMWYFLLDRPNRTPFELEQWAGSLDDRRRILAALEASPPDWVIDDSRETFPGSRREELVSSSGWAEIESFLEARYVEAAAFGRIRVLGRRPE